jgi:hypothetical protein
MPFPVRSMSFLRPFYTLAELPLYLNNILQTVFFKNAVFSHNVD